jgi:hypothetical protein
LGLASIPEGDWFCPSCTTATVSHDSNSTNGGITNVASANAVSKKKGGTTKATPSSASGKNEKNTVSKAEAAVQSSIATSIPTAAVTTATSRSIRGKKGTVENVAVLESSNDRVRASTRNTASSTSSASVASSTSSASVPLPSATTAVAGTTSNATTTRSSRRKL